MTETKVHDTGAQRSGDADDVAYSLIPSEAIERLARTLKEGAVKYSPDNWRKGFKWRDTCNHCLRHIFLWLKGDKSEDHLAHAVCNLFFLMWFEAHRTELDDRYVDPLTHERINKALIESIPLTLFTCRETAEKLGPILP